MAWIDIPNSDIDVDSPVRANVLTVFRDNQIETRRFGYPWTFGETTVTETSFTIKQASTQDVPNVESTVVQRLIRVRVQAKVSSGGTFTLRLKDPVANTTSAEVPVTNTVYAWYTLTLNMAESLRGTSRTINIEGKVASGGQTGTVYVPPGALTNCEMVF